MVDTPGVLFIGAACFLMGLVFEGVLWDIRSVTEPFTEETANAIRSYYVNATIGTRRRAPYLLVLMPLTFLVIIGSLAYKCFHGLGVGDRHAVVTSAASIVIIFPQIVLAAVSTFPSIRTFVTQAGTLPLETRYRLHRRVFLEHVVYLVLTIGAIIAHVAM